MVEHLDSQLKYTDLFAPSCGSIGDFTDIKKYEEGYVIPTRMQNFNFPVRKFDGAFYEQVHPFDPFFFFCTKVHPTGALLFTPHHSQLTLLQHLCIQFQFAKKPLQLLSDVPKYWLDDDGTMSLDSSHRWLGRGMGSPIPRPEEGAWVREDPKVFGGGFWLIRWSLRPGTMKEHGYVTLPSRSVGAVLGDLDAWTDAAWSTGRRWLGVRSRSLLWSIPLMVRQVRWTPACGHTEFSFRRVPLLFMLRGVGVTFLGWSLSLEFGEMNGLDVLSSWMSIPRLLLLLRKWMGRWDGCNTLPLFPRPWVMTSFLWLCPG